MNLKNYISELKRRRVIKASLAYLIVAWVIAEVASVVLPTFNAPAYFMKTLLFILIIGFPINLVFAWIYDITAEGIKKTEDIDQKAQKTILKNSRLNKVIIASLAIVVVLLVINQFWYKAGNREEKAEGLENIKSADVVERSIAVLPFKSLSEDKEKQFLADGMMEAILLHLFKIDGLRVIQSISVEKYRDRTQTIPDIAQELKVNYILDGSFQKYGDQAKLIVKLSNAKEKEENIWAKEYNRDWSDIFSVQSEVAKKVAFSLEMVISPEVKERIETLPTENMDAYEYFLKGNETYWESWDNFDLTKLKESIEYYQRAINLDENFSFAFTGIGRSYWFSAYVTKNQLNKSELWRKSKQYLKKAISLDPDNGWAYAELAVVLHNWNWDSEAARENLDKAIELMPNDANAYIHYFWLETYLGNCSMLKEKMEDLEVFDPNIWNPSNTKNLMRLQCQNKYSEMVSVADEYFKKLDESLHPVLSIFLFDAFLHEKEYEKAKIVLKYVKDSVQNKSNYLVYKAMLHAKEGDRKSTMQVLDSLNLLSKVEYVSNIWYAAIYASLEEKDSMYKFLNRALTNREPELHDINFYSVFNTFEEEPKFQEIIRKMWIPIYEP